MTRNFTFLTALAGGSVTDLDGVMTAGGLLAAGVTALLCGIAGVNGGGASFWQLQARSDATGPGLQRPADFNAGAPLVWVQIY